MEEKAKNLEGEKKIDASTVMFKESVFVKATITRPLYREPEQT